MRSIDVSADLLRPSNSLNYASNGCMGVSRILFMLAGLWRLDFSLHCADLHHHCSYPLPFSHIDFKCPPTKSGNSLRSIQCPRSMPLPSLSFTKTYRPCTSRQCSTGAPPRTY